MSDTDPKPPFPAPAPGTPEGRAAPAAAERGGAGDLQAYLGAGLRAVFDDVAKQPIPDRFLDLMRQLDAAKPGS